MKVFTYVGDSPGAVPGLPAVSPGGQIELLDEDTRLDGHPLFVLVAAPETPSIELTSPPVPAADVPPAADQQTHEEV